MRRRSHQPQAPKKGSRAPSGRKSSASTTGSSGEASRKSVRPRRVGPSAPGCSRPKSCSPSSTPCGVARSNRSRLGPMVAPSRRAVARAIAKRVPSPTASRADSSTPPGSAVRARARRSASSRGGSGDGPGAAPALPGAGVAPGCGLPASACAASCRWIAVYCSTLSFGCRGPHDASVVHATSIAGNPRRSDRTRAPSPPRQSYPASARLTSAVRGGDAPRPLTAASGSSPPARRRGCA